MMMKKVSVVAFIATTCAVQRTLAASSTVRGGSEGGTTPDAGDPQGNIEGTMHEFDDFKLSNIILEASSRTSHRSLQTNDTLCGIIQFPCTNGGVCKPNETGAEWCFCDVSRGFINDELPGIPEDVVQNGLLGYISCIPADECTNQGGTTNVCAASAEGGGCEDRDPDNGQYMCFCKEGFLAVPDSIGAHGPEACEQVNECQVFPGICGDRKVCTDTPGSFDCTCKEGLLVTEVGDCLDPPMAQNLTSCDPTLDDDCSEPERKCDEVISKCVCIDGFFQPAGAGGQCQQENECESQTDVACDRRGRGGTNPRSKCIDRGAIDGDGNPRQGYTCECLPGFIDATNTIRGTKCLDVIDPTPAPITPNPTTLRPVSAVIDARPLPCSAFTCQAAFSFCAAERNTCECQNGYIQSLGSTFACEEKCSNNTDCLDEIEECFESRCRARIASSTPSISLVPSSSPSTSRAPSSPPSTSFVPSPFQSVSPSTHQSEIPSRAQDEPSCTNAACPSDTECGDDGSCQACQADYFRETSSTGGCINPCDAFPCPAGKQCFSTSSTTQSCGPFTSGVLSIEIFSPCIYTIDVPQPSPVCTISDLNVFVDIEHSFIADLHVSVIHSDDGIDKIIDLWELPGRDCDDSANLKITFDDEGEDYFACGNNTIGVYKPTNDSFSNNGYKSLATFNGDNATGSWDLNILAIEGTLNSWSLDFECEETI